MQGLGDGTQPGLEFLTHPLKRTGVGALKRIDRLLEVADNEDRAVNPVARAPTDSAEPRP